MLRAWRRGRCTSVEVSSNQQPVSNVSRTSLGLVIGRWRYARLGKRVAAQGFARAWRAVGGIACKPASALGPPQRCVASPPPDWETRFAGTWKPHGKRFEGRPPGLNFQPPWGFSINFLSRRNGGLPKPSKTAPRPAGFPSSREAPLCELGGLCVRYSAPHPLLLRALPIKTSPAGGADKHR